MNRIWIMGAFLFAPTQAAAFDYGFVRGPEWMDQYLEILLPVTVVGFLLTILLKPRGVAVNEMYMNFGRFNLLGRLVYGLTGLAFIGLMGMVFLGMGLQRAAEAGV